MIRRKVPQTMWMINAVPEWPTKLNVQLVVKTASEAVVESIEVAAAKHGIELERIEAISAPK